ncbi:hypothetical protein BGW39_004917 [Mortierella sp. 14UC]|nr:hypothetical protein BGW39_004917 [Mortierella sp. 14UC]
MKLSSILISVVALTLLSTNTSAVIYKMRCKHRARSVSDDYGVTKGICDSLDAMMRYCMRSGTYYCQVAATSLADGQYGTYDKRSRFQAKCGGGGNYINHC